MTDAASATRDRPRVCRRTQRCEGGARRVDVRASGARRERLTPEGASAGGSALGVPQSDVRTWRPGRQVRAVWQLDGHLCPRVLGSNLTLLGQETPERAATAKNAPTPRPPATPRCFSPCSPSSVVDYPRHPNRPRHAHRQPHRHPRDRRRRVERGHRHRLLLLGRPPLQPPPRRGVELTTGLDRLPHSPHGKQRAEWALRMLRDRASVESGRPLVEDPAAGRLE